MLDSEIHNGLDKQEIRDFLGQEVGECWDASSPEFIKEEIARLEKKLDELNCVNYCFYKFRSFTVFSNKVKL